MPQVIGRWRVVRSLGEGGQAHTYLVVDASPSPQAELPHFVLKRLKNPERSGRFEREISSLIELDHPNILKIIDLGTDGDKPYFVSEYCGGGDLEAGLERVVTNSDDAMRLFVEVSEGAAAAHSKNIIHRDIKPANIFLREADGPAVLGDFGLAWISAQTQLTGSSEAVGSRLFMAPELEDGRLENVTPAADVYSLGKVLYTMLSGGRVFSREKHRLPEFNLVGITGSPRMEHVNRLLDNMITDAPSRRIASAAQLVGPARNLRRLLSGQYNVIGSSVPQPCLYCGVGTYRTITEGSGVRDLGLNAYSGHDWRVLACSFCGHIQFFRVDLGDRAIWAYGDGPASQTPQTP